MLWMGEMIGPMCDKGWILLDVGVSKLWDNVDDTYILWLLTHHHHAGGNLEANRLDNMPITVDFVNFGGIQCMQFQWGGHDIHAIQLHHGAQWIMFSATTNDKKPGTPFNAWTTVINKVEQVHKCSERGEACLNITCAPKYRWFVCSGIAFLWPSWMSVGIDKEKEYTR